MKPEVAYVHVHDVTCIPRCHFLLVYNSNEGGLLPALRTPSLSVQEAVGLD